MDTVADKPFNELVSLTLEMASLAGKAIVDSVRSLDDHDTDLARTVIERDAGIDRLDERIGDICMDLLKEGYKGRDLRLIASTFKSVADLERIGDYTVAIAQVALSVANKPVTGMVLEITRMSELAVGMLKTCSDAYSGKTPIDLESVFKADREIDELYNDVFRKTVSAILEDPRTVTNYIYMTIASRAMERIGDHITNIAERIEYIETGKVVRRSIPMHIPAASKDGEA